MRACVLPRCAGARHTVVVPKLEAYDTQDDIPEALRDYYVEREGKWVPEVPALHSALSGEKQQRAAAIRRADAAEAKARELETRLAAIEARGEGPADGAGGDGERGKEVERLKREYDERLKQIETKLTEERERREAAERDRDESAISDHLRGALLEEGVPKGAIEDLIVLPRFRQPWRKTDNGYAPFEGEVPRIDPDSPSKPMSAKAYAREFLRAHPHWLPGSSGSGASGSGAAARGGTITVSRSELRDAANYQRVQEQAAKTGATIQVTD